MYTKFAQNSISLNPNVKVHTLSYPRGRPRAMRTFFPAKTRPGGTFIAVMSRGQTAHKVILHRSARSAIVPLQSHGRNHIGDSTHFLHHWICVNGSILYLVSVDMLAETDKSTMDPSSKFVRLCIHSSTSRYHNHDDLVNMSPAS